jgi:hypothetical protein
MKPTVALIILMAAELGWAQTNTFLFPVLLSSTNSVLMTNAEFRSTFGNKVIFKSDDSLKGFAGPSLHSNVLQRLGLTLEQLETAQVALDAKNKRLTQQEMEQQKQQAILRSSQLAAGAQKAEADAAAKQKEVEEYQKSHPATTNKPAQGSRPRRMGY